MSGILAALAGIKTAIASAVDTYFNLTTLLLSGDGTNGAQNNTFLDSSTNNFTITRNGNTTQGTFSPFSQTGWSNYLNGSSYFNAGTSLFNYTTGNASTTTFTIEAFVYLNSYQTTANSYHNPCIIGKGDVYLNLGVNGSGNLVFYHYDGSARTITGSSVIPKNTWTYVAVRVTGGTATLYVGSSSDGSGTWYGIDSAGQNTSSLIGRASTNASSLYFDGYIASLRVSTTARTISVPTAAYSNDANTALLVCQSNRFVDQSSNAYSLTITGSPSVQAFSPFAPTAAYSAATNGGSGYFDGSGDYLSLSDNAAFAFGSGDFTIECWAYTSAWASQYNVLLCQWNVGSAFIFRITSSLVGLYVNIGGTQDKNVAVTNNLNTWDHFAVTRSGGTLTFYKNGDSIGTAAISGSINDPTDNLTVGILGDANSTTAHTGYISGLRVIKGSAVAPTITSPPTNITNTSLLLNFTNGGIIDATSKNVLETVGNAQISTTQSKFGGSSVYLDGSASYLRSYDPNKAGIFGTGQFTVECFIYPTSLSQGGSYGTIVATLYPSAGWQFVLVDSTGVLRWDTFGVTVNSSSNAISANTWQHIAVTRDSSNVLRLFVNGTQVSTNTTVTENYSTSGWLGVGYSQNSGSNDRYFRGYIDDLRITKGYARYTTNFTAPTVAFPLQ